MDKIYLGKPDIKNDGYYIDAYIKPQDRPEIKFISFWVDTHQQSYAIRWIKQFVNVKDVQQAIDLLLESVETNKSNVNINIDSESIMKELEVKIESIVDNLVNKMISRLMDK